MKQQTVADILGAPDSWPNFLADLPHARHDMRLAIISELIKTEEDISVGTVGATGGNTLSVFAIEDDDLRERVFAVLKVGQMAGEAAALRI